MVPSAFVERKEPKMAEPSERAGTSEPSAEPEEPSQVGRVETAEPKEPSQRAEPREVS